MAASRTCQPPASQSADRLIARPPRVLPDGLTRVFLHSGYSLEAVDSPLVRYSVAGKQAITLSGSGLYESTDVVVRFVGAALQTVDVSGQVGLAQGKVSALTGAWATPDDWCHRHPCSAPCSAPLGIPARHSSSGTPAWHPSIGAPRSSPLRRFAGCTNPTAPARSGTCVPDLPVKVSYSLDGGVTFSNSVSLLYGFVRPLKIAFLYPGPVTDFGWTYSHNKGRLHVETEFGGLLNAATYVENVDEGEFEGGQLNKGETVATGTPVNKLLAGGARNFYYAAWTKLKKFCDEDFDLVMSTSFGFMTQTLDVSSGYAACRTASDGVTPHPTRFLHAGGFKTNDLMSTAFAKIYQMRYLTGLVAGDALRASKSLPYATPRNGTCVGYVAAFPVPEVQRGINAFALGCRARFPACTVKVKHAGALTLSRRDF